MLLNFAEALRDPRIGGAEGIVRLANEARSPASYLLATILPERVLATYVAKGGSMIVRTTMAGLVGLDSEYPEGGAMELSTFMEQVAKVAVSNRLQEQALRELQEIALRQAAGGMPTVDIAVNAVLNFVNKLLMQPHYDRREWLRGQALFTGSIDWRFNGAKLAVDYQVPAGNILPTRTGNDAYGGSSSKFWDDVKAARKILGNAFRGAVATRATIDEIIYNEANKILVTSDAGGRVEVVRYLGAADGLRPQTLDARERILLVAYDKEGEVWDIDNPGKTKKVPLVPGGVLGFFGSDDRSSDFIPGEGATQDPENDRALGYTHIGPTVEGNGAPGMWARVYTPENLPMQLAGDAVENVLPVIENAAKVVLASTTLSA